MKLLSFFFHHQIDGPNEHLHLHQELIILLPGEYPLNMF